jgi:hypothetical protein
MCFGGGGNSSKKMSAANNAAQQANTQMAQQQRSDEIARQNSVNESIGNVNNAFSQFNDSWFGNKRNDYLSYYTPQVDQQYAQAQQDTLYQLARQGLNNSSAGGKVYSDLARDYGNQKQSVQSGANAYEQQARAQVEAQRNNLINQATATANPSAAASAANNAVGSLQMIQPSGGYSPLAGLFNTFAGAAANGIQNYAYGNNGGLLGQVFKNGGSGSSQKIVGA